MSTLQMGRAVIPLQDSTVTPRKSPTSNIIRRLTGGSKRNDSSESRGGNRNKNRRDMLARNVPREVVSPPKPIKESPTSGRSNGLLAQYGRRRTWSVNTVMSEESCSKMLTTGADNSPMNVMKWLESSCPGDVLPKILAFAGPQTTSSLSKTNKHWNNVIHDDATWRIMCEDLYKVRFRCFKEQIGEWSLRVRFSLFLMYRVLC